MHNKQATCSVYARPEGLQRELNFCEEPFLSAVTIMARLLLYSMTTLRHHPSFPADAVGKAGSLLEDATGLISN